MRSRSSPDYMARYYQEHRAAILEKRRERYWRYRDKIAARLKRQRDANRASIRTRDRARWYGLTTEELEAMRAAHAGRCAICGKTPEKLHIDHDHQTGRVRGLLCPRCNKALGFVEDDAFLVAARAYLERTR